MFSLHIYMMLIYGFISAYGKLDPNTDRERANNNKLLCAQVVGTISHISDDGFDMYGTATSSPVVNCEDDSKYCYALWKEEITNGSVATVIMGQGCWETSGKPNDCERTDCISDKKSSRAQNNTRFCCCSGDLCNLNVTQNSVAMGGNSSQVNTQTKSSAPHLTSSTGYPVPTVIAPFLQPQVVLLYGVVVLIPITFALLIYICWWRQPKKLDIELGGPVDNGNGGLPAMPSIYNLENVKLTNIIGQGHYGSVWKAVVDTQDVAVKAFPAHHKHYFLNEYDLYQVVGDHVNLATCFGGGERCVALPNSTGITTNYLLLLGLEKECLQEYLKKNTLDLLTLSRMSLGIAKGLAHLHCDLKKLCVAHRDLNTRNILVSADLTCRICDLGLAVVPRRTENRSLSEAGTLRYMAPEVLEGAVNLRDCESALKQIDVYALGLVLWELCGRCTDLQSVEPEPYAPPFHHETGDTPTLEQMQALVSRHKTRPLWPVSWRDEMAAARLLVETTEDCWDQDAEARLTSLCVEERLLELRTLRDRNNHTTLPMTPTPLINNNHLTHDQFSINNHHLHFNNRQHQYIDSSVSTIETLLSPSDDNIKNSNQLVAAAILQPHQGKNPCMERNLLNIGSTEPNEQLIDKSAKHCYNRSTTSIPTSTTTFDETQHLLELEYSLNGDNSSNYYKTCRALPIPYLQNAVHSNQDCDSKKNSTAGESSSTMVALRRGLKKIFHVKKEDNGLLKDTQVRILPTTTKVVNRTSAVSTNILSHQTNTTTPSSTPVPRPSTLFLKDNNSTKTNSASGITQLLKAHNNPPTNHQLARQRSLEQFHEIFSSSVDLSRLKDVAVRVKTPGDVPASVRRTRGKAARESCSSDARTIRFSLYDDRMMTPWGSAPHLEPLQYCVDSAMVVGGGSSAVVTVPLKKGDEKRDRDSVSSL